MKQQIIDLINREVIPAIGCTESIAVALCTAKAAELLGTKPEKIELFLSGNIIKNAMGVGIPGTGGMIGLPIAVALGALIGKSEYQLEVLRDCNSEAVELGKKYIDERRINISLKETDEKLYIEVICSSADKKSVAIIAGNHTNFIHLESNGEVLHHQELGASQEGETNTDPQLTLRQVWDFAMNTPVEDLRFILKTKELNDALSKESLNNHFGHEVGCTIRDSVKKIPNVWRLHLHAHPFTHCSCLRCSYGWLPYGSNVKFRLRQSRHLCNYASSCLCRRPQRH